MTHTSTPSSPLRSSLLPLVVDVGTPLSTYYVLRDAVGLGLVASLALSSIVPAVRTIVDFARTRRINGLAALMFGVNTAGIATSFIVGNPRIMIAKDSLISSVIAMSILLSVRRGSPLMSAGLKLYLIRGSDAAAAAWDRLSATSARFRTLERRYTMIWGLALLGDCLVRVAGALLLPVSTMVWLSTVIIGVAIGIAAVASGGAAAEPMDRMMKADQPPKPVSDESFQVLPS